MRNEKRLPFGEKTNEAVTTTTTTARDNAPAKYNFAGWSGIQNTFTIQKLAPKETKCKMVLNDPNGVIRMEEYHNGILNYSMNVMPDFADIKVIKDNNNMDRVVIARFADGSETKATLDGCDRYSLEQGISVCVAKRLLDDKTRGRHGSSMYNKIIRRALQVMHINEEERQKAAYEHERKEKRYAKFAEKKRKRDERRAAAHREAEIEMRKEAYIRAMRELQKENAG